jgi:hypothetical protein
MASTGRRPAAKISEALQVLEEGIDLGRWATGKGGRKTGKIH